MFKRRTEPIKTNNGVSELIEVKLGGYKQFVLIRGENRDNPILLFLHGGPGTSNIGSKLDPLRALEDNFTVVNWDQLGAGLSYYKEISKEAMTVEKMIEYTKELIEFLLKRFNKEKIYLMGHSWGSFLGLQFVNKHPEMIEKYIGISQFIGGTFTEKAAYNYCQDKAIELNNRKAIKELNKIGKPPYKDWSKGLKVRNRWSTIFKAYMKEGSLIYIYSTNEKIFKEYKFTDIFKYFKGINFSLNCLWPEITNKDLSSYDINMKVPIYFLLGRHDNIASNFISEEFFNNLDADEKEIIWFENSAHMCFIEEKDKFIKVINTLCKKV